MIAKPSARVICSLPRESFVGTAWRASSPVNSGLLLLSLEELDALAGDAGPIRELLFSAYSFAEQLIRLVQLVPCRIFPAQQPVDVSQFWVRRDGRQSPLHRRQTRESGTVRSTVVTTPFAVISPTTRTTLNSSLSLRASSMKRYFDSSRAIVPLRATRWWPPKLRHAMPLSSTTSGSAAAVKLQVWTMRCLSWVGRS
jgi:hypothetical protein